MQEIRDRTEEKTMSASDASRGSTPYYFVPAPSRHPAMAATGLFFVILGAGQWINGHGWGKYSLLVGLLLWAFTMFQWFREAIRESEGGLYSDRIDVSFRWSMSWFIFSEVMFFARLLRRAVLVARCIRCRRSAPRQRDPVARLQGRLAEPAAGRHRLAGRHRRALHDDGPVAAPDASTPRCC